MSIARKLEVGCSIVLGLLEIALTITILYYEYKSTSSDSLLQYILVFSLFYILPGALVIIGSYFHAIKQHPLGGALLIAGCLSAILAIWLSLVAVAVRGWIPVLWRNLNVAVIGMAILTLLVSIVVALQNRKVISSS